MSKPKITKPRTPQVGGPKRPRLRNSEILVRMLVIFIVLQTVMPSNTLVDVIAQLTAVLVVVVGEKK